MHAVMNEIDGFRRQLRQVMEKYDLGKSYDGVVRSESKRLANVKVYSPTPQSPHRTPGGGGGGGRLTTSSSVYAAHAGTMAFDDFLREERRGEMETEEAAEERQRHICDALRIPDLYRNTGAELLLPEVTFSHASNDDSNAAAARQNKSRIEAAAEMRRLGAAETADRRREAPMSPQELRSLYASVGYHQRNRAQREESMKAVSPVKAVHDRTSFSSSSHLVPKGFCSSPSTSPLRQQQQQQHHGWKVAPSTTVLLSPDEMAEKSMEFEQELAEERENTSYHRHLATTRGYYEEVVGPVMQPIDMSIISPLKEKRRDEVQRTIRERVLPAARQQFGIAVEKQHMEAVRAGDAKRASAQKLRSEEETEDKQKGTPSSGALFRVRIPVPTSTALTPAAKTTLSDRRREAAERSKWLDEPRVGEMNAASRQRKALLNRRATPGNRSGANASMRGGKNDAVDVADRSTRLHQSETISAVLKGIAPTRALTPPPSSSSSLSARGATGGKHRAMSPTAGRAVVEQPGHATSEVVAKLEPCGTFSILL